MVQRILVVDDMSIPRIGTALMLDSWGFEVDQAESGAQAIEMVKATQYAAIIMDYNMPEMNGLQCASKIRDIEKSTGRHIPIICMSASDEKGLEQACKAAGLDDFLSKDCSTNALGDMILKWTQATK